jgi:hypothetical protein
MRTNGRFIPSSRGRCLVDDAEKCNECIELRIKSLRVLSTVIFSAVDYYYLATTSKHPILLSHTPGQISALCSKRSFDSIRPSPQRAENFTRGSACHIHISYGARPSLLPTELQISLCLFHSFLQAWQNPRWRWRSYRKLRCSECQSLHGQNECVAYAGEVEICPCLTITFLDKLALIEACKHARKQVHDGRRYTSIMLCFTWSLRNIRAGSGTTAPSLIILLWRPKSKLHSCMVKKLGLCAWKRFVGSKSLQKH